MHVLDREVVSQNLRKENPPRLKLRKYKASAKHNSKSRKTAVGEGGWGIGVETQEEGRSAQCDRGRNTGLG